MGGTCSVAKPSLRLDPLHLSDTKWFVKTGTCFSHLLQVDEFQVWFSYSRRPGCPVAGSNTFLFFNELFALSDKETEIHFTAQMAERHFVHDSFKVSDVHTHTRLLVLLGQEVDLIGVHIWLHNCQKIRYLSGKFVLVSVLNQVPRHEDLWRCGYITPRILVLGTPASSVPREGPRYPLGRSLGGPQSQSGHSGDDKNLLTLLGIEPLWSNP
jgi:hypothetical protein